MTRTPAGGDDETRYLTDAQPPTRRRACAVTWFRAGAVALVVALVAVVLAFDAPPPGDRLSADGTAPAALATRIPGAPTSTSGSMSSSMSSPAPTTTTGLVAGTAPSTTVGRRAASASNATTTVAPSPGPGDDSVNPPSFPPFPVLPSTIPPPPDPRVTLYPIPTADGHTDGLTLGPDGNMWFTVSNRDVVGRITADGVVTEFRTPTFGQPASIVTGPDGNLWFMETIANKVARMTTAGVITEFPIPTPNSSPMVGMAVGPDGAIWFAERGAGQLGRVTMNGEVTEFAAGAGSLPMQLVTGTDGNLWFLQQEWDNLARMTPAGVLTEFPFGSPGYRNSGLGVDSHGNLWYTESQTAEVPGPYSMLVRREPGGHITTFVLADRSDGIQDILEGPDGAIWFSELTSNRIGRLGPDGRITAVTAPTPVTLAVGPGGDIWFTTGPSHVIGRLSLD